MPKTTFLLNDYVELLDKNNLLVKANIKENSTVKFITFNSKEVIADTLFICKGIHFNKSYLQEALEKGSICYIGEKNYNTNSSFIIVNDIRKSMALIINFFYNYASSKLNIVGITGTKGKSSTCYFVRSILDDYLEAKQQPKSAIISSIETYDGIINKESNITTPEAIELHRHFDNAIRSKIQFLEMEVSSQALKYDRVLGVKFDVACFLNIDLDHISPVEHKDFQDYFSSKLEIFNQCNAACVNIDDKHSKEILEKAKQAQKVVTFGTTKAADIYGFDIQKAGNGLKFKAQISLDGKQEILEFSLPIPGLFNVQNALAAIAICKTLNIDEKYIISGLKKATVPGRMEVFTSDDNQIITIVDYAHNKLSYETLFKSVKKEYPDRKIISLFGCPGDKAFGRRIELPKIASKYSDYIILSEDDYGEESAEKICKELAKNIDGCQYSIILDRGKAIKKAISLASTKSLVLLLGKGCETHMKRGLKYEECISDAAYAQTFLDIYNQSHSVLTSPAVAI